LIGYNRLAADIPSSPTTVREYSSSQKGYRTRGVCNLVEKPATIILATIAPGATGKSSGGGQA